MYFPKTIIPVGSLLLYMYMYTLLSITAHSDAIALLLISDLGSFSGAATVVDAAVPASYRKQNNVHVMCQHLEIVVSHHSTQIALLPFLFLILCIQNMYIYIQPIHVHMYIAYSDFCQSLINVNVNI